MWYCKYIAVKGFATQSVYPESRGYEICLIGNALL